MAHLGHGLGVSLALQEDLELKATLKPPHSLPVKKNGNQLALPQFAPYGTAWPLWGLRLSPASPQDHEVLVSVHLTRDKSTGVAPDPSPVILADINKRFDQHKGPFGPFGPLHRIFE